MKKLIYGLLLMIMAFSVLALNTSDIYINYGNESSGTTLIDFAGNHNGTLTNGATLVGWNITLDGTDDFVQTNTKILQDTHSILMWIKPDVLDSGQRFVSQMGGASAQKGEGFCQIVDGNGYIRCNFMTGSGNAYRTFTTSSLALDTGWNSLIITHNTNLDYVVFYVDGVKENVTSYGTGSFTWTSGNLEIGRVNNGVYYDGLISNFIVSNESIDQTTATQFHNNGRKYNYFDQPEPPAVIEYPYEAVQDVSQSGRISIISTSYQTILSANFDTDDPNSVYMTGVLNPQYFSNTQPTVICDLFLDGMAYNATQSQTPIYTQAYGAMYLSSDQFELSAGTHTIELKCRGDQATQFDVINANIQLHELRDTKDYNFTSGYETLNDTLNYPTLSFNDEALFLTSNISLAGTNYTRYLVLESAAELTYSGSQTIEGQVSFAPFLNPTNKTWCPVFYRYGGNNKVGNAGYYCVYENLSENLIVNISNYFKGTGTLGGKSHLKELILRDYEFEQQFYQATNLDEEDWTTIRTNNITIDASTKEIYSVAMISFESINNQIVGEFRFLLDNTTNGSQLYRTVQNVNQPGVIGMQGHFPNLTTGDYQVHLQYRTSPGYFGLKSNISILNSTFVSYSAGQSDISPNSFTITAEDARTSESMLEFGVRNGVILNTIDGSIEYFTSNPFVNLTGIAEYYYNTTVTNHDSLNNLELSMIPYPLANFTAVSKIDGSNITNFNVSCNGELYQQASGKWLLYRSKSDLDGKNISCYFDHPDYARTNFNLLFNKSTITSYEISAYTTNSVTFYFKDEDTNKIITRNVTIQLIGDTITYQNSTTTGKIYFDLISPDSYTVRYQAPGYDQNFFSFTMVNNSNSNITLYLSNSTDTDAVTALVIDENSRPVEGARIKTFVENPDDPSKYIISQLCDSNFEGTCVLNLYLGDRAYYFVIEYPTGETKKITNPTYIYDTSISFQIVIGDLAGDEFDKYAETYVSLTHVDRLNTSDPYFSFTWNDGTNLATKGCIRLYQESITQTNYLGETCVDGISGTVNKNYTEVNGSKYKAQAVIYYNDRMQVWDTQYKNYPLEENDPGNNGALLVVIVLLFFGMLLATKPSLLLLFAPLPITLARWLGLINLNTGVIIGLHLVFAMLAYLVSDRG